MALDACWPVATQRGRVLEALIKDGLAVRLPDTLIALPGEESVRARSGSPR